MIVPDANLLIYAADGQSVFHRRAHTWWTDALNSDEAVGLSWLVLLAFIRVMSSPRLMTHPARVDDLLEEVESWLAAENVQVLQPSVRHPQALRSLLVPTGVGGNLANDAHLGALALEFGGTVYSADTDFARFPNVKWVNPLAE
jgi:toxin-antitoxin system PIN domain toxin